MKRPSYLAIVLSLAAAAFGCTTTTTTNKPRAPLSKEEKVTLRRDLAVSLVAHREWQAASQPLLELLAEYPDDAELHALLGTVYRQQGLFAQAEASYASAIRLDPKNAQAYAGRGVLREVSGAPSDAALKDLETAVHLAPEEPAYCNNLGFALYVRGRYEAAEQALQDGLKRDPMSQRMRNNLGFVYGKLGQLDRAKREFEHGGNEAQAKNNLGFVYEQAGDVKRACALYRDALSQNPLLKAASENAHRTCPNDRESSAEGGNP